MDMVRHTLRLVVPYPLLSPNGISFYTLDFRI
jgi:hypothetical protein